MTVNKVHGSTFLEWIGIIGIANSWSTESKVEQQIDCMILFSHSSFYTTFSNILICLWILNFHGVHDRACTSWLQTLLDWVLGLKDLRELLQGSVICLREEEVHEYCFGQIPEDENEIEPITY